jgi:hypothetical protein
MFAIPMAWFEGGGACALSCIFVSFAFLMYFLHTNLIYMLFHLLY